MFKRGWVFDLILSTVKTILPNGAHACRYIATINPCLFVFGLNLPPWLGGILLSCVDSVEDGVAIGDFAEIERIREQRKNNDG